MRTSSSQFQLLVDYMERNGDLSKPNEGPHGKSANLRHWTELAEILNADATGDTKTVEKWRKVWSDLKNNTKKKSARIYRAARTGGGPASTVQLSDLEQRVLHITGTRAATGIEEIPEVGLEEEVTGTGPITHHQQPADDSPSILVLHERVLEQTCSDDQEWNIPGTSSQPFIFQHNQTETNRPGGNETELTQGAEPAVRATLAPAAAGAGVGQPETQRPTPLPPTPRRRRTRRGLNLTSPIHRRTRTQTQSDLARQAFVRSDIEWRNFQQEAEREKHRLRELELRMQERWLDLFGQFIVLGNRIVDILDKKIKICLIYTHSFYLPSIHILTLRGYRYISNFTIFYRKYLCVLLYLLLQN